jgi:hypothetical protein
MTPSCASLIWYAGVVQGVFNKQSVGFALWPLPSPAESEKASDISYSEHHQCHQVYYPHSVTACNNITRYSRRDEPEWRANLPLQSAVLPRAVFRTRLDNLISHINNHRVTHPTTVASTAVIPSQGLRFATFFCKSISLTSHSKTNHKRKEAEERVLVWPAQLPSLYVLHINPS